MTIAGKIESTIAIPGGVTVNLDGNVLTVKGPKGTLTETATGESLPIRKGQSLFLPAGTGAYAVTGTDLKCLRTRV